MKRKFYDKLKNWKDNNSLIPLMVVGARQIGKTYIIDEFCRNEFEDYIYVNLMKSPNIVKIFENMDDSFEDKVRKLELEFNKKFVDNTVLFLDEIQESEQAITLLKFFNESPIPYKIVCAGSLLGVKLRRMHTSFPVGKVILEYMYQMDFEEFLMALDKQMWIDEIRSCYENCKEISIHERLLELYRIYLYIGGMPESIKNYIKVNEDILSWDKSIVKDIITSYITDMSKYTESNFESIRIEKVYNSIPSVLARESKKFQYKDIEEGAKKRIFETSIDWLISSRMVYKCLLIEKPEIPLKVYEQDDFFKLYLNDVGLLSSLLNINCKDIILNADFMFKGSIAENYVADTLVSNDIPLYYWRSGNSAEIDFLIYNDDGIIPIEVKASDNTKSKSLKVYMEKYNPKYAIKISTKNFGFVNGIKSIPLYAAFLIK